jgi:hypothetical protein
MSMAFALLRLENLQNEREIVAAEGYFQTPCCKKNNKDEECGTMIFSIDLKDSRLLLNSCRISSSSLLLLLLLLDGFRLMALKLPAQSLAFLAMQYTHELQDNECSGSVGGRLIKRLQA